MIVVSKVNAAFVQTGGSCVLASYAVVHNYFTSLPIHVCFEAYCRHFDLPFTSWREAEQKYAGHFDNEWRTRNCLGYEVMMDLHSNSSEQEFIEARKHFRSVLYKYSAPHCNQLEDTLRKQEAILNITFSIGGDCHSITTFAGSESLFKKDTNRTELEPMGTLSELGDLRDGLLHVKQ